MSRWTRRSQEEKEAITQKLEDQQQQVQIKKDQMNRLSIDWCMKILKEHNLPIFCAKHGWVSSEKYKLVSRKEFFGKITYVTGNCSKCGAKAETPIPVNSVYTPLFALVGADLLRLGRVFDGRK